ncbi:MAG: glycosyltransferase family 4 protein [Planctomycetaceae bacterium]
MTARLTLAKLPGYWKRLKFEWSQWRWRRYARWCKAEFEAWRSNFVSSDAELLLGAHLHRHGGVRNHLLALSAFTSLRTLLVPTEAELQRCGSAMFGLHHSEFLETAPPNSAIAVHTHVLPLLIDWAGVHAPERLRWVHTHHLLYYPAAGRDKLEPWQEELNTAMLRGANNSDVCLCVSRWEADLLQRQFGIHARYLPNGVDVLRCDRASASRFKKNFRISKPFVLWVGRLDPVKNPLEFIQLAAQNPEQLFVMIGGITSADVNREYHREVPGNLRLLPQLPHLTVLDAVSACEVLVVTSHREGLPTLVLEAMALQKQLVVPNEPGCLDATDGSANALAYKLGDMIDLQHQLDCALRNPQPRDSARKRVLSEFDWRVVAAKLDHVYRTGEVP